MRRITANIIYPVSSPPLTNAYIEIDDNGTITDIIQYDRKSKEPASLEFYNGAIVPGFINCHTHLELSHLKGAIQEQQGLMNFIKTVQSRRDSFGNDTIELSINRALKSMWAVGTNGAGDIVNSTTGFINKQKSKILFHNFIELFNQNNILTKDIINKGVELYNKYSSVKMKATLSPHSMYGTSRELLHSICDKAPNKSVASIHFLENKWESKLHVNKITDYLTNLSVYNKILLVHNLNINEHIINKIYQTKELNNKITLAVCPNSNLYIENKLPDIPLLQKSTFPICLGTDSLASNKTLSVLEEMKTISRYFPKIKFEELLRWATINGAKALNIDYTTGSFKKGKKPGVILLENFDLKNKILTPETFVKRIV